MEKEIPENWVETSIGVIAEVVTGNTPSKKFPEYYGGEIPWVKPADINTGVVIYETKETLTDKGGEQARILPAGSVMVTCIGNLGNVAIAGRELATNQQINSIVTRHDLIDKKYAYYWSLMLKPWLVENSTSTTISMVNKSNFEKAPFLLPPLPEQKRIVAKLDQLFGHLEVLKEKLERIPDLLAAFRQSVLTQAVTGQLTEKWREGKELEEWRNEDLQDLSRSITDGDHQAPPKSIEGIPFLVISNVSDGYLDIDSATRFVPTDYYDDLKDIRKPQKDDILYTVTGSFGIPVKVDKEEPFTFQRHIAIIKPETTKIIPGYLFYYLKSQEAYQQGVNAATGTAQLTIPLRGLRSFKIPVPSLREQEEIVKRLEGLFTKLDIIEPHYNTLKGKIDHLPQVILAKTFRGELVEQLPEDGDARDLLVRIKKEREELKIKKKSNLR